MKNILLLFALLLSLSISAQEQETAKFTGDPMIDANLLMKQKKYRAAKELLEDAIIQDTGNYQLYPKLAHCLIGMQEYKSADSVLWFTLDRDTMLLESYWFKALCNFRWRKDSVAAHWFEKYLTIAPKWSPAQIVQAHKYIVFALLHKLKYSGLSYSETDMVLKHMELYNQKQPGDPYGYKFINVANTIKQKRSKLKTGLWKYP